MKAEEVNRHLEYLGYESFALSRSTRPDLPSKKRVCVLVGFLCALIVGGMAVHAARSGMTSVTLAQVGQNSPEEVVVVRSPVDSGGSLDGIQASGGPAYPNYSGPHVSPACVGPWYPILAGLLARSGE